MRKRRDARVWGKTTEKGRESRKKRKGPDARRRYEQRACDELRDRYIRDLLKDQGVNPEGITPDVIAAKRKLVEAHRLIRAINAHINEAKGNRNEAD